MSAKKFSTNLYNQENRYKYELGTLYKITLYSTKQVTWAMKMSNYNVYSC